MCQAFPKLVLNLIIQCNERKRKTKYFRRKGLPEIGRETDFRQLSGRVAKTIADWGIKQNYFVGIKVPWTLNNDEVWIRTHKLAGKLWFWGGILGIVSLFFVKNAALVMLPIIIVITVVPIVYSYIIYQKIANQL